MDENDIRFGDSVATLCYVHPYHLEDAEDAGSLSYDEDEGEYIAPDKDTYDYWVGLDKAIGEAEGLWGQLEAMKWDKYQGLGYYAEENDFEEYDTDEDVCVSLVSALKNEISDIIADARNGEVVRHIEKNMSPFKEFDFINADVIKGKHGYYLKGEGGARTIFGKEYEHGLWARGDGIRCIDAEDWV